MINLTSNNDEKTKAAPIVSPTNAKEAPNEVCLDIGKFFYENGISFSAVTSPSFVSMCRSIGS